MDQLSEAAVSEHGIERDRYSYGQGHWSSWPDASGRALTLIEKEVLDQENLEPQSVRRNLVTVGVSLSSLVGVSFQIGEVECIGIRPCLPCRYLEEMVRPRLRSDLAGIRGGLRVDVIRGGIIKIGDEIHLTV